MIDGSVLQSAQRCFEKKSRVVVKMVVMQQYFCAVYDYWKKQILARVVNPKRKLG